MQPIIITLTDEDIQRGNNIGRTRSERAYHNRYPDSTFEQNQVDDLFGHQLGAKGELAFAKNLNLVNFTPDINGFNEIPDVRQWEIRTRNGHDKDLSIRETDHDDRRYVLVTSEPPYVEYHIWGWCLGCERKTKNNYVWRAPKNIIYYIPKANLTPFGLPT